MATKKLVGSKGIKELSVIERTLIHLTKIILATLRVTPLSGKPTRVSKLISALKTPGCKADNIEWTLNIWFQQLPTNIFKSTTFDCGKKLSNWRILGNQQDISIFFADSGCLSQRGLIFQWVFA